MKLRHYFDTSATIASDLWWRRLYIHVKIIRYLNPSWAANIPSTLLAVGPQRRHPLFVPSGSIRSPYWRFGLAPLAAGYGAHRLQDYSSVLLRLHGAAYNSNYYPNVIRYNADLVTDSTCVHLLPGDWRSQPINSALSVAGPLRSSPLFLKYSHQTYKLRRYCLPFELGSIRSISGSLFGCCLLIHYFT